jgi:hypothetical protein
MNSVKLVKDWNVLKRFEHRTELLSLSILDFHSKYISKVVCEISVMHILLDTHMFHHQLPPCLFVMTGDNGLNLLEYILNNSRAP